MRARKHAGRVAQQRVERAMEADGNQSRIVVEPRAMRSRSRRAVGFAPARFRRVKRRLVASSGLALVRCDGRRSARTR